MWISQHPYKDSSNSKDEIYECLKFRSSPLLHILIIGNEEGRQTIELEHFTDFVDPLHYCTDRLQLPAMSTSTTKMGNSKKYIITNKKKKKRTNKQTALSVFSLDHASNTKR